MNDLVKTQHSLWFVLFMLIPLSPQAEQAIERAQAFSSPKIFSNAGQKVNLLELYTSEGCSSCPPADQWLASLVDHPKLFKSFVPIALHVSYWDRLGWKDRYASAHFDKRQRLHRQQGHSKGVYTPGFFLAGEEWRGWFSGQPLQVNSGPSTATLEAEVSEQSIALTLLPLEKTFSSVEQTSIAYVVLLGFDIDSKIKAGENRGELLQHNFLALDYQFKKRSGDKLRWEFKPFDLPAGNKRLAFVAWVQMADDIKPLEVVGGWLR